MDKRRRVLTRLYTDDATLVWNGNAVSGQEALAKFFEMLPSSDFQVNTFDCQPVHVCLKGDSMRFELSVLKDVSRNARSCRTELLASMSLDGLERKRQGIPAASCVGVHFLKKGRTFEQATQNQTTVLVVTCGTVKFDGNKQQYFNQNFLLTEQTTNNNTVWKVMSDCLRFQESPH
ncbi:NTF2-related export protein 2 [Crotalus adamanteus]|uniref:NTF2-related export protein 2 n=1 Tax=Crotalus adamanteus TaxID=8729 RepID=A0AAW1AV18_CROAD